MSMDKDQAEASLSWHDLGCVVLDFLHERFQDTSPGDFENTFIKAWDSETKEGLRIEEARSQQESARRGCFDSERRSQRQKKRAEAGLLGSLKSHRGKRRALGDRIRGLACDELPLPTVPLVTSLVRTLRVQETESKNILLWKRSRAWVCSRDSTCWHSLS